MALVTAMLASCGPDQAFRADYERFRSVRVGMTEQEVRNALGAPAQVYGRADAPEDYYVKGYSFRKRAITNKVLIYIAAEPIAYVYLDNQNKVEDVFVGGS